MTTIPVVEEVFDVVQAVGGITMWAANDVAYILTDNKELHDQAKTYLLNAGASFVGIFFLTGGLEPDWLIKNRHLFEKVGKRIMKSLEKIKITKLPKVLEGSFTEDLLSAEKASKTKAFSKYIDGPFSDETGALGTMREATSAGALELSGVENMEKYKVWPRKDGFGLTTKKELADISREATDFDIVGVKNGEIVVCDVGGNHQLDMIRGALTPSVQAELRQTFKLTDNANINVMETIYHSSGINIGKSKVLFVGETEFDDCTVEGLQLPYPTALEVFTDCGNTGVSFPHQLLGAEQTKLVVLEVLNACGFTSIEAALGNKSVVVIEVPVSLSPVLAYSIILWKNSASQEISLRFDPQEVEATGGGTTHTAHPGIVSSTGTSPGVMTISDGVVTGNGGTFSGGDDIISSWTMGTTGGGDDIISTFIDAEPATDSQPTVIIDLPPIQPSGVNWVAMYAMDFDQVSTVYEGTNNYCIARSDIVPESLKIYLKAAEKASDTVLYVFPEPSIHGGGGCFVETLTRN